MGDFNEFCPPPKKDCCPPPKPEFCKPICGRSCCYESRCDNDGLSGIGIIILLIVLYFLFCGNNENGGILGGLF